MEGKSGIVVKDGDIFMPEAVGTDLSSAGKKLTKLSIPAGSNNREFAIILSAAWMAYDGGKLNLKRVCSYINKAEGLTDEYVQKIMLSPEFTRAMLIRGVDVTGSTGLTPEQDQAIVIMSAPDAMPFRQKLKLAGISMSVWSSWLRNPLFKEVWDRKAGNLLKVHENDMVNSLVGQALNGDLGAIKYAFEVSGKHNPQNQRAVDAEILVAKLIEIIQDEVKDLEVLSRIATRMGLEAGGPTRTIEG